METIELDVDEMRARFFAIARDKAVNAIVDNVMSGEYEYHGTPDMFILEDVMKDALGDDDVVDNIIKAHLENKALDSLFAVQKVAQKAREDLTKIVYSFFNQHDIGIA